jgi:hypothetical protein
MYNKILPFLIPLMMNDKESSLFNSQFPKPFKQKKETKNCLNCGKEHKHNNCFCSSNCCKEYNSNDKNEKRKI